MPSVLFCGVHLLAFAIPLNVFAVSICSFDGAKHERDVLFYLHIIFCNLNFPLFGRVRRIWHEPTIHRGWLAFIECVHSIYVL